MATSSYAKTLLGGLPTDLKTAFNKFAEYIFDRTFTFGPVDTSDAQTACQNLAGRFVRVTTAPVANMEVAVAHGLAKAPAMMMQVVSPAIVNSQFLGDLTVSRAADNTRIYLKSASTSVVLHLYCE